MAELRGALIGCGFFAVNHLHGWRDVRDASIISICDTNLDRLASVGNEFGVTARYNDARKMLEQEKPDFVDIATTVKTHKPLVELAAELGIPVICQKPFALNLADAKAMVAACAKAQVHLMVHENFRWQSPIIRVKQAIASGAIGKPFWGRVSFRSAYDVCSGQPYLAEGERFIIEDLGIHALDVARFLLGDAHSVTARTTRINPNIKGEDVATMLLDHGGGVASVVDCSYATKLETEAFPETLVEIDGDQGTLRLAQGYKLAVTTRQGTIHADISPALLPWASPPWHNIQESVALIQQHWINCLRENREPDTSGRDNLQTFALVEAAYKSASSGNAIRVAELIS